MLSLFKSLHTEKHIKDMGIETAVTLCILFLLIFPLSSIGKGDEFFNENYEHLSPCNAAKAMDLELPDGTQFPETTQKLPVYGIHGGKPLLPHSKIKLQLFPVNEGIRIGLEKVILK